MEKTSFKHCCQGLQFFTNSQCAVYFFFSDCVQGAKKTTFLLVQQVLETSLGLLFWGRSHAHPWTDICGQVNTSSDWPPWIKCPLKKQGGVCTFRGSELSLSKGFCSPRKPGNHLWMVGRQKQRMSNIVGFNQCLLSEWINRWMSNQSTLLILWADDTIPGVGF